MMQSCSSVSYFLPNCVLEIILLSIIESLRDPACPCHVSGLTGRFMIYVVRSIFNLNLYRSGVCVVKDTTVVVLYYYTGCAMVLPPRESHPDWNFFSPYPLVSASSAPAAPEPARARCARAKPRLQQASLHTACVGIERSSRPRPQTWQHAHFHWNLLVP